MQRVVAISEKSFTFVVSLMALFGGVIGLIVGVANGSGFWGALLGAVSYTHLTLPTKA